MRFAPIALSALAGFGTAAMPTFAADAVKLPAPDKSLSVPLMTALEARASSRVFGSGAVADEVLSDLLWSSIGVNRPDGRRTAPTALNRQEVDLYVVTAKGAWRYDAQNHALHPVAEGNALTLAAGTPERRQAFVDTAALALIYVGDTAKLTGSGEMPKRFAAVDAGMAAQNALLYCAAKGLACVPRATMDSAALAKMLKLTDTQIPIVNVVVGNAK